MESTSNFVGGKRSQSVSDRTVPVWNPATGDHVADTVLSTDDEVRQAISIATVAFETWSRTSLSERQQIFFSVRDALITNGEELAQLITRENGKTIEDARAEIRRGLEAVEFGCGLPHLLKGEHSSSVARDIDVHSLRQPLGVVACITPFNFPVMVPLWMLANALACGNSVVLKPSEKTPTSTSRLIELMSDAGLPDGVLNLVHGDKAAVDVLLGAPEISAVSFIGSTPVAKYIYTTAAANGKRVQALGGAKNHLVVLPDADMDAAAEAVVSAAFGAAGERCMAVSVVVAVGDAADQLLPRVKELIAQLSVGNGAEAGHDLGPLISREHRDRVADYLERGAAEGAEVVVDGRTHPISSGDGYFLHPSVIDGVTPSMSVYLEEIFGPVVSVVRTDTYDQALELVNEHEFGNGAVVFTTSGAHARTFEVESRAGMIGINVPIPTPVGWFSFGGWKSSLFGDAHMYGPDGVKFFTRQKVITTRWS